MPMTFRRLSYGGLRRNAVAHRRQSLLVITFLICGLIWTLNDIQNPNSKVTLAITSLQIIGFLPQFPNHQNQSPYLLHDQIQSSIYGIPSAFHPASHPTLDEHFEIPVNPSNDIWDDQSYISGLPSTFHDHPSSIEDPAYIQTTEMAVPSDDSKMLEALRLYKKEVLDQAEDGPFTNWRWTISTVERLINCLVTQTCGEGERKIIILGTFHFHMAYTGAVSGEDIWAGSTLQAFSALNYTTIYLPFAPQIHEIHTFLSDYISLIIWEPSELKYCLNEAPADEVLRSDGQRQNEEKYMDECIKRKGYEKGIESWKSVVFHFWRGYSIEKACDSLPFTSHSTRNHQAVLLGKQAKYFTSQSIAFPDLLPSLPSTIPSLIHRVDGLRTIEGFKLVSTAKLPDEVDNDWSEAEIEDVKGQLRGVEMLGMEWKSDWYKLLGQSKVLIGVGMPWISPSPYDALCMGVPFINVINYVDEADPEDRSKWSTQHDTLKWFDPPHIYNVLRGDADGLTQAVRSAVSHPIDRFILPEMRFEALVERHRVLLENDWKEKAGEIIENINESRKIKLVL